MGNYKKVGGGSYGVYKKQSNAPAIIGWLIVAFIVIAIIS